jgi:hypothetical protein
MKARKSRKPETRRYEVRWIEGSMIFMRWFCREGSALSFALDLKAEGLDVIITKW